MENLELNNNNGNKTEEQYYWEIIHDMKWYFLSREYGKEANTKIKEYLMSHFSLDDIIKFKNFVVDKRIYLENRINSYLKILSKEKRKEYKLGDDGTWDLCSHIVGMDETTYYYVLHHIESIFIYQEDIQENFEYGFDEAIYEINNRNIDIQN